MNNLPKPKIGDLKSTLIAMKSGMRAYLKNKPLMANPYENDTLNAEWDAGWKLQEFLSVNRKR